MLQILIQGLLLSGLYALIAMGFTLIFSIGRVLNLAYGAYLMVGGYMYFWVSQTLGMPKLMGVAVAVVLGVLMGVLKYRLIVKTLKGDHVAVEISTLILAVVIQAGIVLVFGDSSKILLPIVPGVINVAGASVTYNILIATLISWAVLLGLYAFVRLTHTGRAMQAGVDGRQGGRDFRDRPGSDQPDHMGYLRGAGCAGRRVFRQLYAALAVNVGCTSDHLGGRRHCGRYRVSIIGTPDRRPYHRLSWKTIVVDHAGRG